MIGDIRQDQFGHFFRDNGDGTFDALSEATSTYDAASGSNTLNSPKVDASAMHGATTVLVRDGKPTGEGDPLAARVAVVMARRYA